MPLKRGSPGAGNLGLLSYLSDLWAGPLEKDSGTEQSILINCQKSSPWTSLVVQQLRIPPSSAGGADVIPGQGTEFSPASRHLSLHIATTGPVHCNKDPTQPKINIFFKRPYPESSSHLFQVRRRLHPNHSLVSIILLAAVFPQTKAKLKDYKSQKFFDNMCAGLSGRSPLVVGHFPSRSRIFSAWEILLCHQLGWRVWSRKKKSLEIQTSTCSGILNWTSLVVQRLKFRQPMPGTRVQSMVREDLTSPRVTKLKRCSNWACAPQSPCSATREATAMGSLPTATREGPHAAMETQRSHKWLTE